MAFVGVSAALQFCIFMQSRGGPPISFDSALASVSVVISFFLLHAMRVRLVQLIALVNVFPPLVPLIPPRSVVSIAPVIVSPFVCGEIVLREVVVAAAISHNGFYKPSSFCINFTIESNECVAISGGLEGVEVFELLLRRRKPKTGQILLDGKELSSLDAACLRRQIGCLTHPPHFFPMTIADNLKLCGSTATGEMTQVQMERATTSANIHDLIQNLPNAYNCLIYTTVRASFKLIH